MMLRKWTLLVITVVLAVFGGAFAPVPAAAAPASFDWNTDRTELSLNGTIELTVSARGLSDMYGYEAVVTYDTDKLTFVSARNVLPKGTANEQNGYSITPVVEGSKVTFAYTKMGRVSGVSGDQPVAAFTFKAKGTGTAAVQLASVIAVHSDLTSDKLTPGKQVQLSINSAGGASGQLPDGNVTVVGNVDAGGSLQVEVKPEELLQAIQAAASGTLRIHVQAANGGTIKDAAITIPLQGLLKDGSGIEEIVIDTGLASVTISTEKGSIFSSGSQKLTLKVSTVESSALPEEVRNLVQGAAVYDFTLLVDGKVVTDFKGGHPITVEMPYTLKSGENPNHVVVYYINDDGSLEVVKNAKYNTETGKVSFHPKHFSKYASVYVNVTFDDLTSVDWAQDSIEALAARGVIDGTGEGKFQPTREVTRAEFLKMLMGAMELSDDKAAETSTSFFSDVEEGAWYSSAIASAQKLGIVNGKDDGTFGINDPITRQDMAVMVYRAAQLLKIDSKKEAPEAVEPFADLADVSVYAVDAVNTMQSIGLINGVGDGQFAPLAKSDRAQAAVIIYRLFQQVE
jgi:hypothetical protein